LGYYNRYIVRRRKKCYSNVTNKNHKLSTLIVRDHQFNFQQQTKELDFYSKAKADESKVKVEKSPENFPMMCFLQD
jgi:hypothetical protein